MENVISSGVLAGRGAGIADSGGRGAGAARRAGQVALAVRASGCRGLRKVCGPALAKVHTLIAMLASLRVLVGSLRRGKRDEE